MTEVLWEGRPDPRLDKRDLFSRMTVIGIGFLVIGVLILRFAVLVPEAGLFGLIAGLACTVLFTVGILLTLWLFTSMVDRRLTTYRLTPSGAEIVHTVFGRRFVQGTGWRAMNTLELTDGPTGDVIYYRGQTAGKLEYQSMGTEMDGARHVAPVNLEIGFRRIPDARAVHALIAREKAERLG